MNANAAASAADLHLKMCKKVAQLTKVIFQLNTRNEDYQAEAGHARASHRMEIHRLTQNALDKLQGLQTKLDTQVATAAQRERQHVVERHKLIHAAQQQEQEMQKTRVVVEGAFQAKVTELEGQVQDAQRAFHERMEALTQLAAAKEKERCLVSQQETMALETKLEELRMKQIDEVEQLVTTSNAKYNKMLAEQLRVQDALKADVVRTKLEWEKHAQEAAVERERELLARDVKATVAFDDMKHELVTKIEALLVDVETLRTSETKLRLEKETLVNGQQEAARTIKRLELQLVETQQDSQSVRRDAVVHSEELQRMLAVSTDKIDELAHELSTLKQTLQTRDRALVQARKELEAAQLETLQQNSSASELQAQLRRQLYEHELQLTKSKSEASAASHEMEAGQKQIQELQAELLIAKKAIADMQAEGVSNAVTRSKLKLELERVEAEGKQAKMDNDLSLKLLEQTHANKLQELTSSHLDEIEDQRATAAKQLEQLKQQMMEASAKSSDAIMTQLKQEQAQVVAEHEAASKTMQTRLCDEIDKLEEQAKALQGQLVVQVEKVAELQKTHKALTQQLESSQHQVKALQTTNAALQSSAQKSSKERDEAHEKHVREMEIEHENAVKALKAAKTQQEQQHAQALLQLTQHHAAALQIRTDQLETQRKQELATQEVAMCERYEPQVTSLRKDVDDLQQALDAITKEATETQRSMEETRLFEQEQHQSTIVEFAQRTAVERTQAALLTRQELEKLQAEHSRHEQELEKRLIEEARAQLASLQAKAELDVARLVAAHQLEVQTAAQEHADGLQTLHKTLQRAQERAILNERADAVTQLAQLSSTKDNERSEALVAAQNAHDQQYNELREQLESTQEALTKKTLDWANMMRERQELSAALAAKTEEMAQKVAGLEKSSREQVETLKLAAKQEMDKLLEENLVETTQLSTEFEETRRIMTEKVAHLKTLVGEWQEKYARRESRDDDVARIIELERLVVEKDALVRRTVEEMTYLKREVLNREEMYNKTFARAPNVGVLQVLKPHVQQMQNQPAPPLKSRGKFEGELQRRRSERGGLGSSPTSAASLMNQKALPPLHSNNQSS